MKKIITLKDVLLIAILLAVGIAAYAMLGGEGDIAVILVDGEIAETLSLKGEYTEREYNGVTVCRENGAVFIKSSTCNDKICIRSGKLKKAGEIAVCAPNRVAVEIRGNDGKSPHAITG